MKTLRSAFTPSLYGVLAFSAVTLAGCAAPAFVTPVEVTRFTGDAPSQLGRGTISIAASSSLDPESLEFSLYSAELAEQLSALGYDVVGGDAAQIAVIELDQFTNQPERRSPVSVGGSAGTGSYGSGVGLGVGINLSPPPADEIDTTVAVYIQPADGGTNLWEGRASFTATTNSEFADPSMAANRAIRALFTDFPGSSGETIVVE